MTHHFTADMHLGHDNIIDYGQRPFFDTTYVSRLELMNETLINNWNAVVAPTDTVHVIGDACMGRLAQTVPLTVRLNGTKILYPGNHDACWRGNSEKRQKKDGFRYEEAGWIVRHPNEPNQPVRLESDIADVPLYAHHFPPKGDSGGHEDRYSGWRPPSPSGNAVLLSGHVHTSWKVDPLHPSSVVNVGVDVWDYRPATIEELLDALGRI